MGETERLSALIGDIYDAALDASLWPAVLTEIADFVDGEAAGLLSKDFVSNVGSAHYHVGVDPHYIQLYQETYWRFDPLSPLLFFAIGEVVNSADLVPDEELREGRFYREWLEPQGWVDAANVVLEKSVTSCTILSVVRKEASGRVDDDMRRRVRLVIPHLRRAVLVGRAIDLKAAEAATFADAFDGLSAGLFLVDANCRIVHANAAGAALLARGDILHVADGRLTASDAEFDRALHEISIAADVGDAAVGDRGIALPLTARDGELHVAHVLPLTSGARLQAGTTYAAVAALFVRKAALNTPSAPEIVATAYRLTPTELRVLLAIVEVGGVPEVAEALGVADSTIKTHLGRLYEKTGARRHADLVKLVADFSSPLLG